MLFCPFLSGKGQGHDLLAPWREDAVPFERGGRGWRRQRSEQRRRSFGRRPRPRVLGVLFGAARPLQ